MNDMKIFSIGKQLHAECWRRQDIQGKAWSGKERGVIPGVIIMYMEFLHQILISKN